MTLPLIEHQGEGVDCQMIYNLTTANEYDKMTPLLWEQVENFYEDENWGDSNMVCVKLVYCLDELRKHIGRAVNIHCAYESAGHADKSQHPLGRAADVWASIDCWDFAWYAMLFPFSGIGIYPHWNKPGIHVDVRDTDLRQMWWRDNRGKYWSIKSLDEFLHLMKVYRNVF